MRTDEERIKAMHRRAAEIEKNRRIRIIQTAAFALCAVMIVCLAAVMPALSGAMTPDGVLQDMNGSIFSGSSIFGCLVIGIIAFILGVSVTVFCYQVNKLQANAISDDDDDKEDSL